MVPLEWHYILTIIVIFCIWLFTSIKKFHKQINKKNDRIPDIKILKKIIPPSFKNGWKVKAVCNALPVWSYSTTFTFAPRHLVATRTLLHAKSSRILEELKKVQVFSMIFPDFPSFKQELKRSNDGDVLYLSNNMFSTLSLPSILLSGQQSELTFKRYWSSESNLSWLYVIPSIQLLTSRYGYWFSFLIIDMGLTGNSVLYILASYPADVSSQNAYQMITSCQVLIKEHIDLPQEERIQQGNEFFNEKIILPKEDCLKNVSSASSASSTSIPVAQKPLSVREAYGQVEEPAVIQHFESQQHAERVHNTVSENKNDACKADLKDTDGSLKDSKCEKALQPVGITSPNKELNPQKKEKMKKTSKANVVVNEKLEPYLDTLREGYKLLISVYEADENTEGWELFNNKNDVIVHKKVGTEEFPNDIYKGNTTIKVPIAYLLNYLLDIEYKTEYDDVFESGSTVEELGDGITKVISLLYKNIWPVTGRDFCSLSAPRHVRDNLYGIMIKAVTHPDCPDRKNKVRGECIIGGYMFEEVSADTTNITFIVCANFNGYIPARIVNKVSSDQPLTVGIVRKKVENRYKLGDPSRDVNEHIEKIRAVPSIFPKTEPDIDSDTDSDTKVEISGNENVNNQNIGEEHIDCVDNKTQIIEPEIMVKDEVDIETHNEDMYTSSTPSGSDGSAPRDMNSSPTISTIVDNNSSPNMLASGFDMKEDHYTHTEGSLHLPNKRLSNFSDEDSGSMSDLSQLTDDGSSSNLVYQSSSSLDEPIEYPRDPTGKIDFATLGNQCAAAVEEEYLLTKDVDTSVKHDPTKQVKDIWKYQGTSKNVVIMRKVSSRHKFHSFLGRGIINVLPVTIWEMIKTPTTRFVYDSMLKKIMTVKEINERCKVVHMKHETTACFVKQARDFCFLTNERIQEQKYILCGTSVDIAECPKSPDCVRGTIFSSGWIIEPMVQNGKSCSLVTYISQVDFGGRLPSRLVNFIAKRQPLAVAYLRHYLEAAEQ